MSPDSLLGDHPLVHIRAIVEGNEEWLDPPVLAVNYETSQDNGLAWSATRRSRGHKPDEIVRLMKVWRESPITYFAALSLGV